ncbi:hypothetical protein [Legionella gresilensis]|uniref:hypothetical protein n=1 Tax=Legionella gresilensis TaxID=91823 RepID=UPI0010412B7B|nr:hypothetical protein [Legionella gresilensis]
MKYIQLPELNPKFSHLSHTKWIISETYLDENNIDSQLCLLDCNSELNAEKIVEQTLFGRSLPGNENSIRSLKVLGKYVLAKRSLLEDFFSGSAVSIHDEEAELLYYITRHNHLIKLIINKASHEIEDDEENYLDTFWGARKAKSNTEYPITAGYFFNHLYLEDFSQVLWLESKAYHGKEMVSAYGIKDTEEAIILKKIVLQSAAEKNITIAANELGIKQNILVAPLQLLASLYGQIREVGLCNSYSKHGFKDESAEIRAQYINSIYTKWDQLKSKSSDRDMNSTNTVNTVLKNYHPVFFNPEYTSNQANARTTEPPLTNLQNS